MQIFLKSILILHQNLDKFNYFVSKFWLKIAFNLKFAFTFTYLHLQFQLTYFYVTFLKQILKRHVIL